MKESSLRNKAWLDRHSNKNGIIYQVTNVVTGDTYVGSTTVPLKKRWYQMVAAANSGRCSKLYVNIREWGKESFDIKELYSCSPGDSIKDKENEFIYSLNPSLNKNLAKKDKNIYFSGN